MKLSASRMAFLLVIASVVLGGCASAPATFKKGDASWRSIELRPEIRDDFETAWQAAVDSVAREYDIELMERASGYLRTAWKDIGANYQGRVVLKFPKVTPPLTTADVKTEARYRTPEARNLDGQVLRATGPWQRGYDTTVHRDVYDAISGRLGRTMR